MTSSRFLAAAVLLTSCLTAHALPPLPDSTGQGFSTSLSGTVPPKGRVTPQEVASVCPKAATVSGMAYIMRADTLPSTGERRSIMACAYLWHAVTGSLPTGE